jgi:nitroreductase
MELINAIKQRKSYRAFKPDQVPTDVIKRIMEQALRAPSWANTQPWEFAVATGKKLEAIQKGFMEKVGQPPAPEVPRPYDFPEPYMGRIRALQPKDRKELTPEDWAARMTDNYKHYGATTCIYLLIGRDFIFQKGGINVWSMFDSGAAAQNIMLLATNYGLGTVAQAAAVTYPDVIRKVLKIPESKVIALGMAIGYPDLDNPVNKGVTTREPMDKVVTYYG